MVKSQFKNKRDEIVLVGVLKNKRDLDILLNEKWYRIPVKYAPMRQFKYLAFYQPALFGQQGKRIQYYAQVLNWRVVKRSSLLPSELNHPKADDFYYKIYLGKIKKLPRPIKNIIPRRISFGFTTLERLLKSKNILQLYNVPPIEQIVERGLKKFGIKVFAQYRLKGPKRYILDFAVFCKKGKIAIECDNKKAHSSPRQRQKDKIKDAFLRQDGWAVIRLTEDEIISDLAACLLKIKKAIHRVGGLN